MSVFCLDGVDESNSCFACHMTLVFSQDVKVFRFYRDLINFQGRGDPSLMLKCINPAEVREGGGEGRRREGKERGKKGMEGEE